MNASDTSAEAAAMQRDIFRRMTPEQRILTALNLSDEMREVSLAGLRRRHPDFSEDELKRELLRIMYGWTPS